MTELDQKRQLQSNSKSLAIVVCIYNELANPAFKFAERLLYYQTLAQRYRLICDVVLVDDGSTDGSQTSLEVFQDRHPDGFQIICLSQNQKKVGALREAVARLPYDYIVATDFDTDLVGIEKLPLLVEKLDHSPLTMAYGFYITPLFEKPGLWLDYYRLTHRLANTNNLVTHQEATVTLTGAGALYRRTTLQQILAEHSGQYCGDDLENSVIGLRLGYQVRLTAEVQALTRPPQSYDIIHRQQCCWKQGRLHVMYKEWPFFWSQITARKSFGKLALAHLAEIAFHFLFPLVVLGLFIQNWLVTGLVLGLAYGIAILIIWRLFIRADKDWPVESSYWNIILLYPVLWLLIDTPAWWRVVGQWGWEYLEERVKWILSPSS